MNENTVKKKIKKFLDEIGAFHFPAAASPYGVKGIPDIIACYKGRFIGIEAKAPNRRGETDRGLSKWQSMVGKYIDEADGLFFVVDGDEDLDRIRMVLEEV